MITYQEALDYLYQQLPMFSRIGAAAFKKDLHNTLALCEALGNPQQRFKSIHIAGTNGKGSTSHMLAAILQQAGYKTGLYTSPHLQDFRERIRINGAMIPEDRVVEFVQRMRPATEQIQPSFFEWTVAMAFDYFASEQVDIAVIETGLGGRLDSTNVITPVVSVITNIGFDHMQFLGNTLPEIAAEKAGIIKPNVPVVIGEKQAEIFSVFLDYAASCTTYCYVASDQYRVEHYQELDRFLEVTICQTALRHSDVFRLDLPGLYQLKNLCTVLATVDQLNELGFHLDRSVVQQALTKVRFMTGFRGRWECVSVSPKIILDVAHNAAGITELLKQIAHSNQFHFVLGMVKDKDVAAVLKLLPPGTNYYFTQAAIPRALPASELATMAEEFSLHGAVYPNVHEAIGAAVVRYQPGETILVFGSVFLVGEVDPDRLNSLL